MAQRQETYKYTEAFQRRIASLCLRDATFLRDYQDVVSPKYFDYPYLSTSIRVCSDLMERHGQLPSHATLVEEMKEFATSYKVPKDEIDDILGEIADLYRMNLQDRDAVSERVVRFGKRQAMRVAIIEATDLIEDEEEFDRVTQLMSDAAAVGSNVNKLGTQLFGQFQHLPSLARESVYNKGKIHTLFPMFDHGLRGGPGRGEVWIVMGLPGCLAGGTVLSYFRGDRVGSRKMRLDKFYKRFNGIHRNWDLSKPTYLYSFDEHKKKLFKNQVLAVVESGIKDTVRLDTSEGSITLTEDHPIHNGCEYIEVGNLMSGDEVLIKGSMKPKSSGGKKQVRVLTHAEHSREHSAHKNFSVEYTKKAVVLGLANAGQQMTYDIKMKSPHHNFCANDFIVHNCGKSQLLTNFGAVCIASEAEPVIHITIGDLDELDVSARYGARLTFLPIDDVTDGSEEYIRRAAKLDKLIERYLRIKYYSSYSINPMGIRAYLERLIVVDGIRPAMLIVDYPDEFKPYNHENMYLNMGRVYSELGAIAADFNVLVWVASQVRRWRPEKDNDVITMDNIADSWLKAAKADGIVSFNQTQEEYCNNRARMFVDKVRRGRSKYVVPLFTDLAYCYIRQLNKEEIEAEKDEEED